MISRDVVMLLMCLMLVGLMRVFNRLVVCLKMALDARLLLYVMSSADKIVKREKSSFMEQNDRFILDVLESGSGENLQSFNRYFGITYNLKACTAAYV